MGVARITNYTNDLFNLSNLILIIDSKMKLPPKGHVLHETPTHKVIFEGPSQHKITPWEHSRYQIRLIKKKTKDPLMSREFEIYLQGNPTQLTLDIEPRMREKIPPEVMAGARALVRYDKRTLDEIGTPGRGGPEHKNPDNITRLTFRRNGRPASEG